MPKTAKGKKRTDIDWAQKAHWKKRYKAATRAMCLAKAVERGEVGQADRPSRAIRTWPDPYYTARGLTLRAMGYLSYAEYLKSDLWRRIKADVLRREPKCRGCLRPATQVHHMSYAAEVLGGSDLKPLVPCCGRCHKLVEFENGRKRFWDEMLPIASALFSQE